ncbi:MAG TPA: DUF1854 domain-containing protein [Nitrosomonas nitrosa]|jgi:hypothetical protein|uniref:DUF1854 domain-containing protein n=1 Tax=Nitrosomonas nitrosa TaxID=52442 RepID=A0A1I4QMY7_9PROT|nr:DUF1854 domain-containing protein [Nitrosomonas nitrosa]MCO6433427.1 DUF1854 domain-containing protein [Nitrosomonas nitrosa]CAE6491591.1 conserved hypothetical protein [Nitrosomonas nitrosa]SFM41065.1 protein of unknown function [Nitrosomonas nitrosa]HBZ29870.1 DUF1854 domain-containing protein [Nitrosomonas nitrosa]HNP50205.1 DUF1854 domain-containing protein [Nitrosomonas nitrosa]
MNLPGYELYRNAFGRLVLVDKDHRCEEVIPVRAFPITAPDHGVALVDAHGHELAWVERLDALPEAYRALIEEELTSRELMPEIQCIEKVSSFATPSRWWVKTDRGETAFVLKGEEDIRRLSLEALLITDSHGIHFLIRDRSLLDRHSRKLLDQFL